jgi:uncharacterized membrane protein YcaP (DUF421 family)
LQSVQLEPSGNISILRKKRPVPGLSLLPAGEDELRSRAAVAGHLVCESCGHVRQLNAAPAASCTRCGEDRWACAVLELDD